MGVDGGVQIGSGLCGERRLGTLYRKGFTLLEVLVAVCAALVVFGIVVGTFMMLEEGYDRETQIADMQHSVAASIRTITQELTVAGTDPGGAAGAGLVAAGSDTIHFTVDLNGDGDVSDADEDITYALDTGKLQLTRNGQPLAEHIPPDGLQFSYFDHNDHELHSTPLNAAAREMVSRITVRLTARTAKPDPNYPIAGGYRTRTLTSDVHVPLLALAAVTPTEITTAETATAEVTTPETPGPAKTTQEPTPIETAKVEPTKPEPTRAEGTSARIQGPVATTEQPTPIETGMVELAKRQVIREETTTESTMTSETTTTEYVDMQGPLISEIRQLPPGSSVPKNVIISVCAAVTDPSGIRSVTLSSDKHGSMTMSLYAGETYCGNLSRHENETVTYYIIAHDSLGNESTSGPYSYHQGR